MQCPGQDSRFWGAEAIYEGNCPNCNAVVEFFKDEGSRKCRKCGNKVLNPKMDFGCAAYCKFASQCLGDDIPPELLAKRSDLLRDRVAMEVKKFLGRDFKGIGRTLKVAAYAERIRKTEGADPAIVTLAAYLSAVSGRNGNTGDGMEAASGVLSRAGASPELSEEVMAILKSLRENAPAGCDRPLADGDISCSGGSPNFECVHDAIRIVELEETLKKQASPDESNAGNSGESMLTASGREFLREVLLDSPAP